MCLFNMGGSLLTVGLIGVFDKMSNFSRKTFAKFCIHKQMVYTFFFKAPLILS